MIQTTYPDDNLLCKQLLEKNAQAVKCLEALGFNVIPCRIGGDGEFGGRIDHFVVSSFLIKIESGIAVKG